MYRGATQHLKLLQPSEGNVCWNRSTSHLSVRCGKGSRKKNSGGGKGKKKNGSAGPAGTGDVSPSSASGASPSNPKKAAPRITGKVGNISVNRQIKLVERFKSLNNGGGGGGTSGGPRPGKGAVLNKNSQAPERTSFRKVKDNTYQEELARRRAEKQKEAHYLSTLNIYGGGGVPPLLLVDGYNVCGVEQGGIEGLRALFMAGDLDACQRQGGRSRAGGSAALAT